jgi:hypothetical protein
VEISIELRILSHHQSGGARGAVCVPLPFHSVPRRWQVVRRPIIIKKQKGSGTTEYILIVAIVLGLFLFLFWSLIAESLESRLQQLGLDVTLTKSKREKKQQSEGAWSTPEEEPPTPSAPVGAGGGTGFTPVFSTEPAKTTKTKKRL